MILKLVAALALGLVLGCSNGDGSNSSGSTGSFSGGKNNQAFPGMTQVAGCRVDLNSVSNPTAFACTSYYKSPENTQITQDRIEQSCQSEHGTLQANCPNDNITGACTYSKTGFSLVIMLYNDSNATDLQDLSDSCQKNGGKSN